MTDALIGYTGFVGGNLRAARPWDALYNSKNFHDMAGQRFGLLVCAGVSAVKWQANREPEADWAGIQRLIDVLQTVQAEQFVLISTIDVFPHPVGVDEATPLAPGEGQPYGRHRLQLEAWATSHFARCSIVRLPGCFGPGLKKNAIYDLLHNNLVSAIDPEGVFQFYDVRRIWADVQRVLQAGLPLVHLATEPVSVQRIATQVFDRPLPPKDQPHGLYDFRTRHSQLWGRSDGYLMDADAVVTAIGEWVAQERAALAAQTSDRS